MNLNFRNLKASEIDVKPQTVKKIIIYFIFHKIINNLSPIYLIYFFFYFLLFTKYTNTSLSFKAVAEILASPLKFKTFLGCNTCVSSSFK